jgi:GntR family transcriptional repressor for pyruvate dehydrogenase complex
VSRPTIRAGLRALSAMGVIQSRHGSGTYISDGPPTLGSEPLRFLAALHGLSREEMYEARRVLEVSAAGLAAERASAEHIAGIAEEVASLFASIEDPREFLVHDIRFHRAVAAASGNQIVASLVEMVSALYYEQRRETAAQATDRNLRDAADLHRSIYQAIRKHDVDQAQTLMHRHLLHSAAYQAEEEHPPAQQPGRPAKVGRKNRGRVAASTAS